MRGNLKSSVQRLLGKEDIVILDSLNYIKGFRYELYCVSKSSRTTHCVVYCITDAETSKLWNSLRAEGERYPEEVIDELIMRFEFPSSGNRWDKPLFSVIKDGSLDIATICTTLFEQKALIPNQSTQTQPLSSTNFLYEMDQITQDIITTLATAQKSLCPGDKIKIKDSREDITFTRPFSMAELQRHRRQFISYTKMHPVEDTSKLSVISISVSLTFKEVECSLHKQPSHVEQGSLHKQPSHVEQSSLHKHPSHVEQSSLHKQPSHVEQSSLHKHPSHVEQSS
ncbi:protein KTI12 [Biomphalaria glabrata]